MDARPGEHDEQRLRRSNSALRGSATEPERLYEDRMGMLEWFEDSFKDA